MSVRLVLTAPALMIAPDQPRDLDDLTLAAAKRGDKRAFARLVERFEAPVFGLLGRMLRPSGRESLVDDLAQETFVRVFRALPQFGADGRNKLASWILTIATRVALDELRRPSRTEPLSPDLCAVSDTRPDRETERRGLGAAIARAVAELSPEQRATFLLREVHGLEYGEIATALGLDIGTVKSRLSRARAALRAALESCHEE
jgi:RNA polymerase sigma-70 factor (ECF subfamily)